MDWKLEHFRLTVFPSQLPADEEAIWRDAIGSEPERETKSREYGVKRYLAEASRLGGVLQLRCQQEEPRLDWFLGAVASISGAAPESPIAGEVGEFYSEIVSLIRNSSRAVGLSASRLAVGAVFLSPVESREVGYQQLDSLIEAVKVDPTTEDFFYRINHPRPGSAYAGTINRLQEWSVAQLNRVNVNLGSGTWSAANPDFLVRLGVDVNTRPTGELIAPSDHERVFNELLGTALNLATLDDMATDE